jgi:hypothetical protein
MGLSRLRNRSDPAYSNLHKKVAARFLGASSRGGQWAQNPFAAAGPELGVMLLRWRHGRSSYRGLAIYEVDLW